ncbi:stathmin domain-containing protein 1 [Electrophorus electricus]|uniref:stathmin domain-containing protein 1 n=1 Tax=Electrophorus electricus TaxID=8005 RepID=UPI000F09B8C9|nr:stathmin domain-containing protein 1 [Electrophorus electricus]
MGCGSSKITVIEPVKPGSVDVNETVPACGAARGDSAVSKKTTDSGVGLDTGEATVLPVPKILPPLRAQSPGLAHDTQRQESSVILEQLLSQGIIPAQPKVGGGGEAYNIILDDADRPMRRPPPRLESLRTRKEQEVTRKQDVDEKMRQVEERRKVREEELRSRLRAKSARPRGAAPTGADAGGTSVSQLHTAAPPASHLPTADREPGVGSSGGEVAEGRLSDSPELENDSTFQKSEDADELF